MGLHIRVGNALLFQRLQHGLHGFGVSGLRIGDLVRLRIHARGKGGGIRLNVHAGGADGAHGIVVALSKRGGGKQAQGQSEQNGE